MLLLGAAGLLAPGAARAAGVSRASLTQEGHRTRLALTLEGLVRWELAAQAENLKEQVGKLRQLIGGAAPSQPELVRIKKA